MFWLNFNLKCYGYIYLPILFSSACVLQRENVISKVIEATHHMTTSLIHSLAAPYGEPGYIKKGSVEFSAVEMDFHNDVSVTSSRADRVLLKGGQVARARVRFFTFGNVVVVSNFLLSLMKLSCTPLR